LLDIHACIGVGQALLFGLVNQDSPSVEEIFRGIRLMIVTSAGRNRR
jgi:hypothetical protein